MKPIKLCLNQKLLLAKFDRKQYPHQSWHQLIVIPGPIPKLGTP